MYTKTSKTECHDQCCKEHGATPHFHILVQASVLHVHCHNWKQRKIKYNYRTNSKQRTIGVLSC